MKITTGFIKANLCAVFLREQAWANLVATGPDGKYFRLRGPSLPQLPRSGVREREATHSTQVNDLGSVSVKLRLLKQAAGLIWSHPQAAVPLI